MKRARQSLILVARFVGLRTPEEKMPLCQLCGETVPEGACSCPSCGDRVDRSVPCPRCGFPTDPGVENCVSCGKVLSSRHSNRPSGFRVRPSDHTAAGSMPGAEATCAWPLDVEPPRLPVGKRTDPFYLAALLLSVSSLCFAWAPGYNVSLAGLGLTVALLGYRRFFGYRYRSRYRGLWINHLAAAVGIVMLVLGMRANAII